jgi:hypothetical protein
MATAIDAKGDLVAGTGADTFAKLTVGANGTVLTADSAEATGLKWATAGGGGKVLQVVQATTSTAARVASTSMTDSGLSVTITPTLNTSKVLILVSQQLQLERSAGTVRGAWQLLRGATPIFDGAGTNNRSFILATGGTEAYYGHYNALNYLDSPATTSATTYKTQIKVEDTANGAAITGQESSATSSIIALEIGA